MKLRPLLLVGSIAFSTLSVCHGATGLSWIDDNPNLTLYGDIRLRYELDWDSHTPTGDLREDRNRGRARARFGFNYQFSEEWSAGARIRTGDSHSQQSPHLTFATDSGSRDQLDFVPDRYFVQFKRDGLTSWGGRNLTPFWWQNELFWDEDVTLTGLAVVYDGALGEGKFSAIGGGFYLPDGGYRLNGQMLAGQLKYSFPIKPSQFTVAGGLHFMNGEEGAKYLRNRNGERDYLIGTASAQWTVPLKNIPFSLGADVFHNFENYDAADVAPFPASDEDQTLGYVFSAHLGQLKQGRDWLVGYYYAYIETFAVNASYAQDDWHRFGNGPQTDASDFKGHEFRLGYAISKNINVLARVYLVKAITTQQDGNRFRLDLNWKY